jgi:hypothetical protein
MEATDETTGRLDKGYYEQSGNRRKKIFSGKVHHPRMVDFPMAT